MRKDELPVIIEEKFSTTVDKMWNAISSIEEMTKWYFNNIPAFEPIVGFRTGFCIQSGNRKFIHQWEITKVIPFKLIEYNWKYEDYPGDSFVKFEVFEEEGKIRLILTHRVVEDFPDEIEEFKRESCLAGWEYFIRGNLKNYIETA